MTLEVVILAAGQGTRMKSRLPKILHPLGGKPMISYGIEIASAVSPNPPVLIVSRDADAVRTAVGDAVRPVIQDKPLGTANAALQARKLLEGRVDHVMIINADLPLLRSETLAALAQAQAAHTGPITLATLNTPHARGFGRIVRDIAGRITAIVEEAQATPDQLAIHELNLGAYCFESVWLWDHLERVPLNSKGEYYLTDLVELAAQEGHTIQAIDVPDLDEALGINTRVHLAEAEAALRRRINTTWMLAGVTIIDPDTTTIHPSVTIGMDTIIWPNTFLLGATQIGEDCVLGPNTVIDNSTIGSHCVVRSSTIESATIEDHVDVGPFGHLRKGAYLESGVHMGNFGEVKSSRLRRGVKMGHFSYIGDSDVGAESNIGAGTVTVNFDGENKLKTVIGEKVFIGSDTMLVAPITVGDGAKTGAGSVVTHDVPAGGLVYGVPARPKAPDQPKKGKK